MNIIQESFQRLYPNRDFNYTISIKYSRKFKPYNANIKLYLNHLQFNLSHKWKTINKEITIGLIQSLFLKIFKKKITTLNIDLYNSFIKNLHLSIPKTSEDQILLNSFNRINQEYFYNQLEQPVLKWGKTSTTKLGSYEFQTDTITISSIFKTTNQELLDYIIYHELLHKKHKFYVKNNRNYHHTKKFRKAEKQFKNQKQLESELKKLCKKAKTKKFFYNLFR